MPAEWSDFGARWGNDGQLYLAEWRRGFTVHELRALFWTCQQVATLRRERDQARADLDAALARVDALEARVTWLRRQVTAEARLYPLLATLGHQAPGKPGVGSLGDT